MGGRYCVINSPRGSRWGQIFFGPHRGPSGELIAQYRPPMSFCFYPTLYLGNHLYFLKPDSSWKQQKNTWISTTDSVHPTKRVAMVTPQHLLVTSWWCLSSRARQTLRIFNVGKLRPNHSCILIQESFWITIHLYLVKQCKIESSDIFQILEYFQNFDVYFINRYLTVWGFTIVFPQVPLFKKIVRFFYSFVDTCLGTICHHKDITGRVLFWENFISPRKKIISHTKKIFSGKVQIPKWAPYWLRMVQPISRKNPEPPWSVLDT